MSVIPLAEIPTLPQLYSLGHVLSHNSSAYKPNDSHNGKIALIRHDITKLNLPNGAIVNAANEGLLGGGGVDGAIHRAAGRRLLAECMTLGGCETGSAKITDAYKLPCSKVIHAVGPIYNYPVRGKGHEEHLRSAYRTSIILAAESGCDCIAFSALSTGTYEYPSAEAAAAALDEVRKVMDEGLADKLDRIIFCNFLAKDENAYHRLLPFYFPNADSASDDEWVTVESLSDGLSETIE